jgi:hypothetical protein
MLKKPLRRSFFSVLLILVLAGCAPRVAPPPLYRGIDLSIDQVIRKAGGDIDSLKAVADIKIEKNSKPYSFINASVLIKRPGWVHMRVYKFGMPLNDIVIKDDQIYVLSGKSSSTLMDIGKEFYPAVFWWDDLKEGIMYREEREYIILTENKEVHLESATLFPLRQEIRTGGRNVDIIYGKPEREGEFWYPSLITVHADNYIFSVRVERVFIDPPLGENDFKITKKR